MSDKPSTLTNATRQDVAEHTDGRNSVDGSWWPGCCTQRRARSLHEPRRSARCLTSRVANASLIAVAYEDLDAGPRRSLPTSISQTGAVLRPRTADQRACTRL